MRNVMWPSGRSAALYTAALMAATLVVSGCAETQLGAQLAKSASRDNGQERGDPILNSDETIAPEEFDATGLTIWDGARTLQGVWVAHPLATTARRVRVVNTVTGETVEGAMFRRDPSLSGPSILVSSDAATGLGLKAGTPTALRIVALRDAAATPAATVATPTPAPAEPVQTAALPAPAPAPIPPATSATPPAPAPAPVPAGAAAPTYTPAPAPVSNNGTLTPSPAAPAVAPAPVPATPAVAVPAAASAPKPEPRPATLATSQTAPAPVTAATGQTGDQDGPLRSGDYVQAGAFGVEPNARALVDKLRARGLPAQYVRREVNGAKLNIVMIGPLSGGEAVERAIAEANAAGVPGARKVTL